MENGKILAVDYGEKKVGLAISEGLLAEPRGILNRSSIIHNLSSLCKKEKIKKIIVGVSRGKMAEKTRRFGRQLKEITGLPVEFLEEDLTSKEARRKMIEAGKAKRRRKIDEHAVAAALILERYLDNKNLTNY